MRFRPCIDIHNGKVKQIVGGSLTDTGNKAVENFISEQDGAFYARLYQKSNLEGGHIIILNPVGSEYYEADCKQAELALQAYPGGLQVGGGITDENAAYFLEKGASHVIVTSFVFQNGEIQYENLNKLVKKIGRDKLVLDLSCRKKKEENGLSKEYYIVTNRWQNYTNVALTEETLEELSKYCDEFLVHAVDVEGKASGIEGDLAELLGKWNKIPITYAGGVGSFEDLWELRAKGKNHLDVTIGSALDLFGGNMSYEKVLKECEK